MHILHIGKYYWPFHGGLEQVTQVLAEGAQRDSRVTVLVHGDANSEEHIGGVRVRRVRAPWRVFYAPIAPGFPCALAGVLRQANPDLLHIHMPNLSAFLLLLSPAARRRPWILHWHADVVFQPSEHLARWVYRLLYKPLESLMLSRARTVIVTSPNYLESSVPLRAYRDRCRVIPLAAPEAVEASAEAVDWPDGDLRLLMVGRLTPYKGHRVLFAALAALRERDIRPALCVVGLGECEIELREALDHADLADQVSLAGAVSDAELAAYYASCDLLCLPSLDRAEAFGVVLLEAMAHARPTVASAIPGSGVSWVVEDGQTGWLFPPGDVAALADRLAWCTAHSNELRGAGVLARSRVSQRFSRVRVVDETLALYREVLAVESAND